MVVEPPPVQVCCWHWRFTQAPPSGRGTETVASELTGGGSEPASEAEPPSSAAPSPSPPASRSEGGMDTPASGSLAAQALATSASSSRAHCPNQWDFTDIRTFLPSGA